MKIIKVEFSNINSLVGNFSIDFTELSKPASGIFSISGPTGSGKSSILDAIFYALYGKTPRQQSFSASTNEIMNFGATGCRAKLTFEVKGNRYAVTTEQKRTKRAKDPYNQPTRELCRLDYVDNQWHSTAIAKKIKDVEDKIEEITGLNFENARGSFILSQGDFDRFLKTKGNKRADILSSITGTEIYEKIGQAVHSRVSALEAETKGLQRRDVLPEQERKAKEEELKRCHTKLDEYSQLIKQCNAGLDWWKRLSDAEEKCKCAEEEVTRAQTARENFRRESEPELNRMRSAREFQPLYGTMKELHRKHEKADEEHAMAKNNLSEAEQNLKVAKEKLEKATQRANTEMPQLEKELEMIVGTLIPLDEQLNEAKKQYEHCERQAKEVQAAAETAKEKAKGKREQYGALAKSMASLEKRLGESAPYKGVSEALPVIRMCFERLQKALKGAYATQDGITDGEYLPTLRDIETTEKFLEQKERELGVAGTQPERLPFLQKAHEATQKYTQAKGSLQQTQEKFRTAQQTIEALEAPTMAAQQAVESARQEVEKLKTLRAVQLADLYQRFLNHEFECCPCCGSPTPGNGPAVIEEGKFKAAQTKLSELERKYAEAKAAYDKAKKDAERVEWDAHKNEEKVCETAEELQAALSKAGLEQLPTDLEERITREKDALESRRKIAAERASLQKKRECSELCNELLAELEPFHAGISRKPQEIEEVVRELTKRAEEIKKLNEELERVKKGAATAKEEASVAEVDQHHCEETSQKCVKALNEKRKALDSLKTKRTEIWPQQESATDAHARLSNRIKTLTQELETCRQDHATADSKQKQLTESYRMRAEVLRNTQEEIARTQADLERACRSHGFQGLADLAVVLEDTAKLPELEKKKDNIDTQLKESETRWKTLKNELKEIRERRVTEDDTESLSRKLETANRDSKEYDEKRRQLDIEIGMDDENKKENAELEKRAKELEERLRHWQLLKTLLGNKAEGFKRYAQKITFEALVEKANQSLLFFNRRYSLRRKNDEFGLEVIDHYVDDVEGRDASNLSGGESFVVSLALALGLSQLAGSGTRIDTLFLDEGFGTLDSETLEQVLDSLDSLRSGGKTIGIITHVQALHDRLPEAARLEVQPIPATGRSVIKGAAVKFSAT